jgi:Family of unknown function (DUF6084)
VSGPETNGRDTSAAELADEKQPDRPTPEFEVVGVEPVERAAAPTLRFRVRVNDPWGRRVYMIALSTLITVEPVKRTYDPETRERLVELFGEPERWATTTTNFRWIQTDVVVPAFTGSTEFDLPIACTYDLELAASKYFHGLADGNAPLRFHFNGTVFYEGVDGAMQLLPIPWDCTIRYAMPVEAWKTMIASHYPYRGWIALHAETIERLARLKAERGLPTFDACVSELLEDLEA